MKMLARTLPLVGLALFATACLDPIPGGQLHILGDTTHTTFAGNENVKDGKIADAKSGFTIEEGYAGVVEIDVGEPDKKTGLVEGKDYLKVSPTGVTISPIADSHSRQWLVTVERAANGSLPTTTSLEVSHPDYEGSFTIPVRIVPQAGAGAREEPPPWPYGNTQTGSSSTSSSTGSGSSSTSSTSGGAGGGG